MTGRGIEIRVGFFVVLASVIAVVGTMWFQAFRLTEQRYYFHARFNQVGGLVAGDPVFIDGVESGRVDNVELAGRNVVASIGVRRGIDVPVDSRVALKSVGIMGERLVAITRGDSTLMTTESDTLDGEFLAGLSEVMGAAGKIVDDVAAAAHDLRSVTEMLARDGNLDRAVTGLADASDDISRLVRENGPQFESAVDRFDRLAARLDSLVSTNYAELDTSLAAFGRAGTRMEGTVENLSDASEDLKEITAALREGDGTLGRLLQDDGMAVRMEATISRLDSLIADIKKHPHRYVQFKLF